MIRLLRLRHLRQARLKNEINRKVESVSALPDREFFAAIMGK